jgi:hypothetical protein
MGPALKKAHGIAGEFGAAILRVDLAHGGPHVVVEPPTSQDRTASAPPNLEEDTRPSARLERRVPATTT